MGKPTICINENKGADQLRSNCEADQRLCFRYSDSTIPPKFQASSLLLKLYSPVCVGPCRKPYCWFFPRGGSNFQVQEESRTKGEIIAVIVAKYSVVYKLWSML